ncbi:MAG: sensor histidine kinase, partial [Stackebrandtia sp.]
AAMAADLIALTAGATGLTAFVLYIVAKLEPRSRSIPALAACASTPPLMAWLVRVVEVHDVPVQYGAVHIVGTLAALGVAWTLGNSMRLRQARAVEAEEHRARQQLTEERLRIARELHDVVAHSLSLITIKAGVAIHVAEQRPEEALDTLRVIEETSRAATEEMRQVLGVLRSDGAADAGCSPSPGLRDLPQLTEQAGKAGVRATLRQSDLPRLSDSVELSIYRIVQEAVTNVVKHAAPADCQITLRNDDGTVIVEVTDNGPGPSGQPGGHGLIGMRERAALYGGTLTAGRRPGGGFTVAARLPVSLTSTDNHLTPPGDAEDHS